MQAWLLAGAIRFVKGLGSIDARPSDVLRADWLASEFVGPAVQAPHLVEANACSAEAAARPLVVPGERPGVGSADTSRQSWIYKLLGLICSVIMDS